MIQLSIPDLRLDQVGRKHGKLPGPKVGIREDVPHAQHCVCRLQQVSVAVPASNVSIRTGFRSRASPPTAVPTSFRWPLFASHRQSHGSPAATCARTHPANLTPSLPRRVHLPPPWNKQFSKLETLIPEISPSRSRETSQRSERTKIESTTKRISNKQMI